MLFSSLALHMLLLLLMGCSRRRRERRESGASVCPGCSLGAARVQPGCCPWWRGTVCTLGTESTNTSPVKETKMNLKYQSLSKERACLKGSIIHKKYIQACNNKNTIKK
jgi:hypothetical protein